MKISRITKQKRGNRYNIFITDNGQESFGFGVDEDILVKYHLHKNMPLSESLIATLKQQDTIQKSYQQAINYLSYRMRSRFEMEQYLQQKDVEQIHINEIIERLESAGLLDDLEFANAFVRERMNQSNKGPRYVKQELVKLKGIADNIASEALEQYTFASQFELAMKTAKRHIRRESKDSLQKKIQRLQAALLRNGFYSDVIQEVIQESKHLMQEQHDEWQAIKTHGEKLLQRHKKNYNGHELKQKVMEGLYRQGFSFDQINKFLAKHHL